MKLRTWLIITIILSMSIIIRIPGLFESLWWDEAYRTHIILNRDNLISRLLFDVHNFLYNSIMYVWVNLFGDSELSIRIPSLLLGYGSVFIFYSWVSKNFSTPIAMYVAALILVSPFHVWYSTEAKNNSLVIFFTVLIFVSYSHVLEDAGWKWVLLAVFAGVLGIFTDFLLAIPLLAALITAIFHITGNYSKDKAAKLIACFYLTIFYTTPLIIFKLHHVGGLFRSYLKPFNIEELFLLLFNFFPNGNAVLPVKVYNGLANISSGWHVLLLAASGCLFGFLLFKGLLSLRKKSQGVQVNIFFITPIICMFLMTLYIEGKYEKGHYVYIERNLGSILFYFYALVVTAGAFIFKKNIVRTFILVGILILSLSGTLMMLTINKDRVTVYKPNPDWRAFADDVIKESKCPFVFTSCPHGAMDYYLRHKPSNIIAINFSADFTPGKVRSFIVKNDERPCNSDVDFIYLAINKFWGYKRAITINDRIFKRIFTLVEKREYLGLNVYKYRP